MRRGDKIEIEGVTITLRDWCNDVELEVIDRLDRDYFSEVDDHCMTLEWYGGHISMPEDHAWTVSISDSRGFLVKVPVVIERLVTELISAEPLVLKHAADVAWDDEIRV